MSEKEKIVGTKIKLLRKKKGITLRELARRAGFTAAYISLIENSKVDPSLHSLRKISEALDVSILSLIHI